MIAALIQVIFSGTLMVIFARAGMRWYAVFSYVILVANLVTLHHQSRKL
jgi:hypothetical protein